MPTLIDDLRSIYGTTASVPFYPADLLNKPKEESAMPDTLTLPPWTERSGIRYGMAARGNWRVLLRPAARRRRAIYG